MIGKRATALAMVLAGALAACAEVEPDGLPRLHAGPAAAAPATAASGEGGAGASARDLSFPVSRIEYRLEATVPEPAHLVPAYRFALAEGGFVAKSVSHPRHPERPCTRPLGLRRVPAQFRGRIELVAVAPGAGFWPGAATGSLAGRMFDSLSDRFEGIFNRLRGRGRLGEAEVDEVLREIRLALLEADVNFKVVRGLVGRIREACVGAELHKSLSPAQQVIKIVHNELIATLGGETLRITFASRPPTVVLLAGLQGSGKTTAAAKLGRWFRQQGRNPFLVGADLQRPAAVEQLRVLGGQAGVPVFSEPTDPVSVARKGVEEAQRIGRDVVLIDTAGRLTVDESLMEEVRRISEATSPHYTFLVIDAMIGQDAVTTAAAFHAALELDGVILSKLDGDARGGAALSVKEVVGRPIAFASVGEKLGDFEPFHPDRMASRILGMGDVLTLIEKAEREYDADVAAKAATKLQEGNFTLEDFLEQMQQIKKMGPLQGIIGMLPGIPKELKNADIDDGELARVEAIIRSMTPGERQDPELMNGSRRLRVARGSGSTTSEVNLLLKQFQEVQNQMRNLGIGPKLAKAKARGAKSKKKGGRVTPRR